MLLLAIPMVRQRRGRHVDADDYQPVCLLVVGDSACVRARRDVGIRTARCVCGDDDCVFDAGGGERCGVQTWKVEEPRRLKE